MVDKSTNISVTQDDDNNNNNSNDVTAVTIPQNNTNDDKSTTHNHSSPTKMTDDSIPSLMDKTNKDSDNQEATTQITTDNTTTNEDQQSSLNDSAGDDFLDSTSNTELNDNNNNNQDDGVDYGQQSYLEADGFDDFDNNDDFNEFSSMNNDEDDGFNDFDDFQAGDMTNDDEFGDFGDIPEPNDDTVDLSTAKQEPSLLPAIENQAIKTSSPSIAEQYAQVMEKDENSRTSFIQNILSHLWTPLDDESDTSLVDSPASNRDMPPPSSSTTIAETSPQKDPQNNLAVNDILCTQCSLDLWQKLSRDSVFYNPITGSIGQFQWTRSEINRAYLNALGVQINYEDRLQDLRPTSMTSSPSLQQRPRSHAPSYESTKHSPSSPSLTRLAVDRTTTTNHTRSNSLSSGLSLTSAAATMAALQGANKPPVEEEPELDIDIAKAYCELTEETIRVFPDVKLNAMVVELSRLQRQAKEYLGYLLDQREQLMMDAETYNDLISCIVGHAQRLREQNVAKDGSPAMVSKKKKTGGFSGMIKRKNTTGGTSGTSMGGGVVGVKPSATTSTSKSIHPGEGRRSM
ncbi:uncharacterized protein BX664DRAFT_284071 [Halteromyces radiatus]|uniref:uncharacterized protein n=1 Tax=Halteromyces radiatus TaxID=101107 RepID=UPI00221F69B0|nr:uncharacterized protein BX664DRAFT_284071 [Halteromyces radiatus]KAI8085071.1 hypothetical protein BX664DRAFT_284071 [Halteromyces radiatus]